MSDPFKILRDQGVPTVGYGVLDAPDQRLREIAIKAQAGQGLEPRDVARLAQRQGVELETARVARESAGFGGAGVPVSSVDFLAGSRLDPQVQQAAAQEAVLANHPVVRAAKLQQAQNVLTEAQILGGPEAQRLRALQLQAQEAEALAAISQNTPTLPAAPAPLAEVAVSPAVVPAAPDVSAAPVVEQAPAGPEDFQTRLSRVAPKASAERSVVFQQERARRFGASPVYPSQLAALKSELAPKAGKRSVVDPLTKATYEFDVEEDALGNVYRVGAPSLKSAGPLSTVDEKYAPEYTTWTNGGSQQMRTNIAQLGEAIAILEDPKTVMASGGAVSVLPEWARVRLAGEKAASVQSIVEGVVQQSLRDILGGQFAQKEGEALLKRAFDVRLPEEENARRARVLAGTLSRIAAEKDAAAGYYAKTGTLAGFAGAGTKTMQDIEAEFNRDLGASGPAASSSPAAQQSAAKYNAARDAYLKSLKGP